MGVFEDCGRFLEDRGGVGGAEGGEGESVLRVFEKAGDVFFCFGAGDVGGARGEDGVRGSRVGVRVGDADGVELLVKGGVGFG